LPANVQDVRIRALAIGISALILAGCTAAPSEQPSPTTTPTPTVTEAVVAGPDAVIPVSCSELVPAATIQANFGVVPPEYGPLSGYGLAANRQLGWDLCSWYSVSPDLSISITFQLRHDGAVVPETQCYSATADYANCTMTGITDGWLVRGQLVTGSGTTPADAIAATTALFQPVFDRLAEETAPAAWTRPDGVGPSILDCTAVSASLDISVMGLPDGATVTDVTGQGEDGSIPRDEAALGGETLCVWRGDDATSGITRLELAFLAGGAWAWDELIPGPGMTVEPVTIAGTENGAFECADGSGCSLIVRLGPDLIRISGAQGPDWTPISREQLLAAGDELAPAVLAVVG
jgi:hypothetical protein